jgi:asparagine synthetase B (glutamine-hydrolysing)
MLRFWMSISPVAGGGAKEDPPGSFHVALDDTVDDRCIRILTSPGAVGSSSVTDAGEIFRLRVGKMHLHSPVGLARDEDDVLVDVNRVSGHVNVLIPPTSQIKIFYRLCNRTLHLSSDLRLLAEPDLTLDGRGVHSLFQFGAAVPPLSLWKEIGRMIPGRQSRISLRDLKITEEALDFWDPSAAAMEDPPARGAQLEVLRDALDASLRRLCPDECPAILFSGGVDSGLFAARAAVLGWKDSLLVNYSRGEGDEETELAKAMAGHLGLRMVRVVESARAWSDALGSIGEHYSHPFGDYATFTSFHLVRHILQMVGPRRTIVDGAGADGLFGSFPKLSRWRALYRIPGIIRRVLSAAYGPGGFWARRGRLGRRMAWARMSCEMDFILASMVAENPLRGVAYHPSLVTRREVEQILLRWLSETCPFDDVLNRARWLDTLHLVNELTAQKSAAALQGSPVDISFPFLDPGVVRLALQEIAHWPQSESKEILKRLLAAHVPPEMVYRPKSGPAPPITDQFRHPSTVEAFHEAVLSPRNPLLDFVDGGFLRKIVDRAGRGRPLAHFTHNFLWTLLFTSLWIHQVGARR